MKILIIDQFSELGGAQLCIRDLAPEIARRGWQATFIAPGEGRMRRLLLEFGIASEPLNGGSYTNGRKTLGDFAQYLPDISKAAVKIRGLIEQLEPDLIYVNGPRMLPACVLATCPVVFHCHSRLNKAYSRFIAAACVRLTGAQVVAVSEFAQRPLRGLINSRKLHVIYSGVSDMGFVPKSFAEDTIRVGMIGRFAPEKGQLDFLRAARLLVAFSLPKKTEFILYGASVFSNDSYEQQMRDLGAGLPVTFAGWSENVADALHQLHVIAVPSASIDAAPRVVMEAMSAGTVVVAYPSGGIPEMIDHGRTGVLTRECSPNSLAHGIADLMAKPEWALTMRQAARADWERRFQISRYQAEVCDFLETVVRSSSSSTNKRIVGKWDLWRRRVQSENQSHSGHSKSI